MQKRIRYASEFAWPLTHAEIDAIVGVAEAHNREHGITGVLFALGKMFFQIIEGPSEDVDALYVRIQKDRRHENVVLLSLEMGQNLTRLCPDWAMRKVDLTGVALKQVAPLATLLRAIEAQSKLADEMRATLEEAVWELMLQTEFEADLGG